MKRLIGMQILLVLASCGPDLTQTRALAQVDNQNNLMGKTSECEKTYQTLLKEVKNHDDSDKLIFTSTLKGEGLDEKLSNQPATKERCLEVENSLSLAPVDFKLEIKFNPTSEQHEQMVNGNAASVRPESARLEFQDGSLNTAHTAINMRCPDAATLTCRPSPEGEGPCRAYDISYVGKCTFTSDLLFYTFSDLKKTRLELKGEIEFSDSNGAEMRFDSVSWKYVY